MPINKVEGISGSDKICTLHPFKVISIIGEDDDDEVTDPNPPPKAPEARDKSSIIDWIILILQWFKNL